MENDEATRQMRMLGQSNEGKVADAAEGRHLIKCMEIETMRRGKKMQVC